MKKSKRISLLVAIALVASVCVIPASATSYTAMIIQGNTPDVGDCKVVFENIKNMLMFAMVAFRNCGQSVAMISICHVVEFL